MALNLRKDDQAGKGNGACGDGALCFGPHDLASAAALGHGPVWPIGYPRLYGSWLERIRAVSRDYLRSELQRYDRPDDEEVVSLFSGSTVEGIFGKSEFEQWLKAAIRSVNREIDDGFILIKPHPMQDMAHLAEVLSEIEASNVGVTHLHAGVLASRSRLIIAHHSGTILDALSFGVPTIQFQELTPGWMEHHPEGSSYLELGLLWARNGNELDGCIKRALSPQYAAPDLSKALGHRQDLTPFIR
jgi:hypothetical protein